MRVEGVGFRVWGSGFRVKGLGFRFWGVRVQGLGFGYGCRVKCTWSGIKGFGFEQGGWIWGVALPPRLLHPPLLFPPWGIIRFSKIPAWQPGIWRGGSC